MNAWIRANAFFLIITVTTNACNVCNFLRICCCRFNIKTVTPVICYSPIVFDFYFRLTVFILWRMVFLSVYVDDKIGWKETRS